MPIARPAPRIYAALAATAVLALSACAAPVADAEPQWKERLLDAPDKPEDLIQLSTGEVLVSGMAADPGSEGSAGSLYSLDPGTGETAKAWPHPEVEQAHDTDVFGACPGPLDDAVVSPHGLGAEVGEDGIERLYVVNHGGRESIEVFEVGGAGQDTTLTWVGCAVLPEGGFGNGVAADPAGDGFYVTDFLDPADMEAEFERAFAGEATGEVLHWSPGKGWTSVPGSEMSTPNGVAVSEGGDSLYVASWGGRELVELDAETGARLNEAPLEVMPDNLRSAADGRILVTGQVIDDFETFLGYEFGDLEPAERYDVYLLDPETFTVETAAAGEVAGFGNPTTALEVGESLFVGSVAGDKILQLDPV